MNLEELKQRVHQYVEVEADTEVKSVNLAEQYELFGRENHVFSVHTNDPEEPEWWVVGGDSPLNLYAKSQMPSPDEAFSFHSGIMLRMAADQLEDEHKEVGYDAFISHASEDKSDLVRPLAGELSDRGFRIWYDEFELNVGDSLRESIDRGLVNSRYGIVVLSPAFFGKDWPQYELNGLTARDVDGRKVILPIWHDVDKKDVLSYSPTLADKMALPTKKLTLEEIADSLAKQLAE